MLGLKLPTDPRWVNIIEMNLEYILSDHAWCEHKATAMAMKLIISNADKPELIEAMIALVKEEISHFKMVHDIIQKKGYNLRIQEKDEYVNLLLKFFPKGRGRVDGLTNMLLIAALIEARSCERFRLLSESLEDKELADFYFKLMKSEANHYTMFLKFARKYDDIEIVNKKWGDLLNYEAKIMLNLGKEKTMHG